MKALLWAALTLSGLSVFAADLVPTHTLVELKNVQQATCAEVRNDKTHLYDCSEITCSIELDPRSGFPKREHLVLEYPVLPDGCYSKFPELDKVHFLRDEMSHEATILRTFGEMELGVGVVSTCIGFPARRIQVQLGGWQGRQVYHIPRTSVSGQNDYFTVQFDVNLEGNCKTPETNAEEAKKNSDCTYKIKNVIIKN